jgi:hypothetical protein
MIKSAFFSVVSTALGAGGDVQAFAVFIDCAPGKLDAVGGILLTSMLYSIGAALKTAYKSMAMFPACQMNEAIFYVLYHRRHPRRSQGRRAFLQKAPTDG